MRRIVIVAIAGFVFLGLVQAPRYFRERAERMRLERHQELMEVLRKGDVEAAQRLAQEKVDIYAPDTSGESPLSLAEKSGNAPLLEALRPRRIPEKDLRRAQLAADTGIGIGLASPATEREFNVFALIQGERQKARAAGRPEPDVESLFYFIEEKINALPEGERKENALRQFASRLAEAKLNQRARDVSQRIKDVRVRVESLLNISQGVKDLSELRSHFDLTRQEIDRLPESSVRDPLYAQLAHWQKLRGDPDSARSTCAAIERESYKNGACLSGGGI